LGDLGSGLINSWRPSKAKSLFDYGDFFVSFLKFIDDDDVLEIMLMSFMVEGKPLWLDS